MHLKLLKHMLLGTVTAISSTLVHADDSNRGSTDPKLSKLPEVIIPIPDGDIRPILAVAAKFGSAKGEFTGKVAKQVFDRFGKATVRVKAVKMSELSEGCPKIIATIYQVENPSLQQEIPFRVCPNQ